MKEEIKRFYTFPFEVAREKLGIEGDIIVVTIKDDKGKDSKVLTIITAETKEK